MIQRYSTGEEIDIGDHILWGEAPGLVVFVIDREEYLPEFKAQRDYWSTFGSGIGLQTERAGLVLEHKADEDLEFIKRGSTIS